MFAYASEIIRRNILGHVYSVTSLLWTAGTKEIAADVQLDMEDAGHRPLRSTAVDLPWRREDCRTAPRQPLSTGLFQTVLHGRNH